MIRLPSPVVCVEDAPVPELIVNRTEVADLLAALVRPPPPRRRQPYDVGPGPHSHRDRWRARVNRLNDLAALTFQQVGDGAQRRRLAGAIAAEQGHEIGRAHV